MTEPIRKTADRISRLVDGVMEEATAPASVLIVERDAALRERMVQRVRGQGYRVDGAEDLREGVFLADELAPDVVVVSVGAGGWEPAWALRVFRVLDMTARIPIVGVVSADVPADALDGFEGVIPRAFAPYRLGTLVARVMHHLEEGAAGRMRVGDLSLATPFPAQSRFGDLPDNEPAIRTMEADLAERGIAWRRWAEGDEVVLSYALTVADAFALGYNAAAPEELRFALEDAFPELAEEPLEVDRRIRDLERLWGLRRGPVGGV